MNISIVAIQVSEIIPEIFFVVAAPILRVPTSVKSNPFWEIFIHIN